MVGAAFDELRVVIQQETDGLLQPKFAGVRIAGAFLMMDMVFSPFTVRLQKLLVPDGKNRRHRTRCPGRERPPKLFGRLKAQKVGSLPPRFDFSRGIFFSLPTPSS